MLKVCVPRDRERRSTSRGRRRNDQRCVRSGVRYRQLDWLDKLPTFIGQPRIGMAKLDFSMEV